MSFSKVGQKIRQTTEIYSLAGFREDNSITTENFEILIDEYELDNEEVHCCQLKKHGNLCNQKHKHGYLSNQNSGMLITVIMSILKEILTN